VVLEFAEVLLCSKCDELMDGELYRAGNTNEDTRKWNTILD
jgi:hypothetical protein